MRPLKKTFQKSALALLLKEPATDARPTRRTWREDDQHQQQQPLLFYITVAWVAKGIFQANTQKFFRMAVSILSWTRRNTRPGFIGSGHPILLR